MPEPLRALFVNEGALGPSVLGHAQVAATLESQLRVDDIDASFRTLPSMGRLTRMAAAGAPLLARFDLDAHAVRWHLAQALRARRLVNAELRREPVDVLHLHGHTLAFLLADQMHRVPTFVSIDATVWDWHSMEIWRRVRAYSRTALAPSIALERRSLRAAWRTLAFTNWAKRRVEQECPEAHVVVHHPGIDLDVFSPGRSEPRVRPRVLFVGGRFAEKGGNDLVEALGPLAGRTLDVDVVTQDAVNPPVGIDVHRIQPRDRKKLVELYRRADVFCLPTQGDAAPWALLEAMACGVPVIATPVGGIPDLLDGGRAGLLVEAGKPADLRAAVEALLADKARRAELSTRARAHCERHFNGRTQAAVLLELIHEANDRGSRT